jgi:hypothetical protein
MRQNRAGSSSIIMPRPGLDAHAARLGRHPVGHVPARDRLFAAGEIQRRGARQHAADAPEVAGRAVVSSMDRAIVCTAVYG